MPAKNVTAVVLRATDYKDYDRLLRLFTPDEGVLSAVIKGVRRPKAKLKFAAQPFSLNEYALIERGGYHTVTECAPIETMFEIASDPDRYMAGAAMLETTERAVGEIASPETFVVFLKALKSLAYSAAQPYAVLDKYLIDLLRIMGYGFEYRSQPFAALNATDYEQLGATEFPDTEKAAVRLLRVCEDKFLCSIKATGQIGKIK